MLRISYVAGVYEGYVTLTKYIGRYQLEMVCSLACYFFHVKTKYFDMKCFVTFLINFGLANFYFLFLILANYAVHMELYAIRYFSFH